MTQNEWAANRQRKKMNKEIIELINSFESLEQDLSNKLINTVNKNFKSLYNIIEKQNDNILKQNQLLMILLTNNIKKENNNSIIEYLPDNIPKNIKCPNCSKEFYTTNKYYYENHKCPYCNHELENIKALKIIKITGKMEEGLCPYCKSKVHTNDLICPECYEKITPIYDKLLHEKTKKEIELQEQSKKRNIE